VRRRGRSAFVALYGDNIRAAMSPPKLALRLVGTTDLGVDKELIDGEEHSTPLWWFHLRVVNERRRIPVHGVRMVLSRIEYADDRKAWERILRTVGARRETDQRSTWRKRRSSRTSHGGPAAVVFHPHLASRGNRPRLRAARSIAAGG
jgi:hypothetical protein